MSIALGQPRPAAERFDALFGSPAGAFPAPASPEIESHPRWMEPGMQWIILRELFVERLETKSPGATYNQNVRRVLVRFSRSLKAFQIKAGILPDDCVRLKNLRSTSATLVGDQFNDGVAKRKLKQSPASRVFERHYKSRAPTAAEAAATDFLLDRFLSAAGVAGLS